MQIDFWKLRRLLSFDFILDEGAMKSYSPEKIVPDQNINFIHGISAIIALLSIAIL